MISAVPFITCLIAWILATISTAVPFSYMSSPQQRTNISLHTRDDAPQVPERPMTSGPGSFHGSRFEFLQTTGFEPAVDAMPVFLFSRTAKFLQPCYPESAVQHREKDDPPDAPRKPNKGTHVPAGANPGKSCTDPGPYSGAYSLGNSFPVYVTASYCNGTDEWMVNYDLYYVHDGVMSLMGHRHDWEGITVVWQRDEEGDWWHRAGAIYNTHSWHNYYNWNSLRTVDVDTPNGFDVRDDEPGTNKKHPKVYVGFFTHSAYREKNDHSRKTAFNMNKNGLFAKYYLMKEYRSDDWWRLPRLEDIHPGEEIPAEWKYGHATSNPMRNKKEMCDWNVDYETVNDERIYG